MRGLRSVTLIQLLWLTLSQNHLCRIDIFTSFFMLLVLSSYDIKINNHCTTVVQRKSEFAL
jgi:hypothetical protein